jgi:hypothetical protein
MVKHSSDYNLLAAVVSYIPITNKLTEGFGGKEMAIQGKEIIARRHSQGPDQFIRIDRPVTGIMTTWNRAMPMLFWEHPHGAGRPL